MIQDSLNKILQLENRTLKDSIQTLNTKINEKPVSSIDLLNQVNSFYDSSWDKLLWVVGALLAIVGVVIPIAIQVYQRWKIKEDKKELDSKIATSVQSAKNQLIIAIENAKNDMIQNAKDQIELEIQTVNTKLEKNRIHSLARTLQLQASNNYGRNDFNSAFFDLLRAAECYIQSDDYVSAKKVLSTITPGSFQPPKFDKKIVDQRANDKGVDILQIFSSINSYDSRLMQDIEAVKGIYEAAVPPITPVV